MSNKKSLFSVPGPKIQLLITIISVAIAVINFIIVSRLAPLATSLADLKDEVKADEQATGIQNGKFVLKDTFDVLITRVNYISGRVDSIYSIVAQLKKQ